MRYGDIGGIGDVGGMPPPAGGTALATPRAATAAERVVFGIDFSPASLGAARWAAGRLPPAAGAARALDACLVHVVPWPDGAAALDGALDGHAPLRAMRPALLGGLAGFAASLRLERARSVVHIGSPSARLAEVAAAEGARLVVLGRRRDAARQRIGEPEVIQRVARRAACDVLVVPERTSGPIEHVVAAVDPSPSAAPVVAAALALAHAHGAALTLAHVFSPAHGTYDRLARRRRRPADETSAMDPAPGESMHGESMLAESALAETAYRDAAYAWLAWLARDAAPPVDCQLAVPTGDPGREIIELAERRGPSVVVLGKRGADGAPRGSLGSVARELVARCSAPVLAVEGDAVPARGPAG